MKNKAIKGLVLGLAALLSACAAIPKPSDQDKLQHERFTQDRNINFIKSLYATSLDKNNPEHYGIWALYITDDFRQLLSDDVTVNLHADFSCVGDGMHPLQFDWVDGLDVHKDMTFTATGLRMVRAQFSFPDDYAMKEQADFVRIDFELDDSYGFYPRIAEFYVDYLKFDEKDKNTKPIGEKQSIKNCIMRQNSNYKMKYM